MADGLKTVYDVVDLGGARKSPEKLLGLLRNQITTFDCRRQDCQESASHGFVSPRFRLGWRRPFISRHRALKASGRPAQSSLSPYSGFIFSYYTQRLGSTLCSFSQESSVPSCPAAVSMPLSSLLRTGPRLGPGAIRLQPSTRVASTLSNVSRDRNVLNSILIANRGEIAL